MCTTDYSQPAKIPVIDSSLNQKKIKQVYGKKKGA